MTAERTTPWLTVREAAQYARCGVKVLYKEIKEGRLKAARIGGRREFRLLSAWLDDWLIETSRAARHPRTVRTCAT